MTESNIEQSIRFEEKGSWNVVTLVGRLDARLSALLERDLNQRVTDGATCILFNLGETESISSSGLQVFLSTLRRVKSVNGAMRICHMGPQVRKVLQVVNMEGMFQIYATETDALKAPLS